MLSKALDDLVRGLGLYKVWTHQAWHDVSAKYKRTVLGTLWMSGSMVTLSICLALVFGALLGTDLKILLPNIMGGLLCFSLISFIFGGSPEVFNAAHNIIKNHAYPFTYYMFEAICESFFMFLNNLIVFTIVMVLLGTFAVPNWTILIGLPIVLSTIFAWGTVIAMVSTRFRDLRFMMPHLSQIVFYLTPIMWSIDHISPKNAKIAELNPFYGLLELIRAPLMGKVAPAVCWNTALLMLLAGAIVWLIFFSAFRKRIPFWV
jgi:ABC-2 type transport system permease protein/lipopolysaccharide transport system permease protein